MQPETISATALMAYNNCPKMYEVEYLNRMPTENNSAAALGSACHNCLEEYVVEGWHEKNVTPQKRKDIITAMFGPHYWELFSDGSRFDEGLGLVQDWVKRTDFSDREVVSTEQKLFFMVPTSKGPIKFNYIMDRQDRVKSTGQVVVVDYKSNGRPMSPDDLLVKIQPRAYALAAQIENPEAQEIRVEFDMLRFDMVGTTLTKDDNRETWNTIKAIAERLVNDDDPKEVLGEGCIWCSRKDVCETLAKHADGGGTMSYDDPAIAAERLREVAIAADTTARLKRELEGRVIALMERDDLLELDIPGHTVKVSLGGRRVVDRERVGQIIGSTLLAKWGCSKVGEVTTMLDQEPMLSNEQKSLVRQAFRRNYGDPNLKIAPK